MENKLLVKVCGMRALDNISSVAGLDIDWMGFIFYGPSRRFVGQQDQELVNQIITATDQNEVKRIGVFVNEPVERIVDQVNKYQFFAVQLHGDESPGFCSQLKATTGKKIIKVFSVKDTFDFSKLKAYETHVDYFLFDTRGKLPGGNGQTFDWTLLKKYPSQIPFLISGGIQADMADQIKQIDLPLCVGVDINSGFEIEPALKDTQKIKTFLQDLNQ